MKPQKILISFSDNLSKLDEDDGEEMTLAQAYREFQKKFPQVKEAIRNRNAAEKAHVRMTREMYRFFTHHGLDCKVLLGKGFIKDLVNPSDKLEESIKEIGLTNTQAKIQHAIVQVNSLALDPFHLRLGDNYLQLDNYPARDFHRYFHTVEDITHLLSMNSSKIQHILKNSDQFLRQGAMASAKKRTRLKRNRVMPSAHA